MRRRSLPLALSLLLLVPVLPAAAVEPAAPPVVLELDPSPPVDVSPSPEASEPAPEPAPATPAPEPSSQPSTEPQPQPDAEPSAAPDPDPQPTPAPTGQPVDEASASDGRLDTAGRWIVLLEPDADAKKVRDRHTKATGVRADRLFQRAIRGWSGPLSPGQVRKLRADPDVAAIVPDEIIRVTAQIIPNGVRRVGGRSAASTVARINGVDERVDADVAVVDTGIDPTHPDLNVVGGVNCSTADRNLWRDVQNHGTHVAGTIGAIDNGGGVVGVAPGVRLWAVKILNDEGFGLLSWYVCGLDWIAAQRDPSDASRPLIEAVNMSVAKSGKDDGNCGFTNDDVLHQAICRVTAAGVTVVAAAANESGSATRFVPAAYNEVITVSALADGDGKTGGLRGTFNCNGGSYDVDDTFGNFSNYGFDVDLIAPGKCIYSTLPGNTYNYSTGTSMAAPAVTGAAALFKASRPWASPPAVKDALQVLGNLNWSTSTDPDTHHEKLLDISRLGPAGDFSVALGAPVAIGEAGGTARIPVTVNRSATHFETLRLVAATPPGFPVSLDRSVLSGFSAKTANVSVTVAPGTPAGTYPVTVTANEGVRIRQAAVDIVVENDPPTMSTPTLSLKAGAKMTTSSAIVELRWAAATDASSPIAAYRIDRQVDNGTWRRVATIGPTARSYTHKTVPGHYYRYRVAAMDAAGNWSSWVTLANVHVRSVQDGSLGYKGTWYRSSASASFGGTARYSYTTGAAARVYLTAKQYALVAPMSPTRGYARIYIDGVRVATVSLYRSSLSSRRIVWVGNFPTARQRLIEVKVLRGDGRPRVDVDAILALRW